MTKRKLTHRILRSRHRSPVRYGPRMLHGARRPNYLALALTAFSRAIRARRRLMKLAPRFFDSAVVDREASARHAELQRRREWEPLLNKAYGLPPEASEPVLEPHCYPSVPRSQRAVLAIDYELASCRFWMSIGRENMDRFKQRRPHALISFPHLARLLEIGFTFARLATGLEANKPILPPDESQRYYSIEEAFKKIYSVDPVEDSASAAMAPVPLADHAPAVPLVRYDFSPTHCPS